MARIRRWFHVSHDINSDGEVWELTDKFGVAGLRLWLEILSIADRNEGALPPLSDPLMRQLSIRCNTSQRRVRQVCDWCVTRAWVVCDPSPRVRNYLIYNPSRDAKSEPLVALPPNPPILSEPSSPYNEPSADRFTERKWENLEENLKRIADRIYQSDTAKFIKLIVWIKQAQKYHYSDPVITEALLRFEPKAAKVGDWYPYLDRIIDKVRADYDKRQSDQEHDQRKQGERELASSLKLKRLVKDA